MGAEILFLKGINMYAVTYYINGCRMRSVFKTRREAIWKADELLEMGFVYGIRITHVSKNAKPY